MRLDARKETIDSIDSIIALQRRFEEWTGEWPSEVWLSDPQALAFYAILQQQVKFPAKDARFVGDNIRFNNTTFLVKEEQFA